jgi:hypothetical protein
MADYYSVVSRAVSGLPDNTYEARRVLYERARAALQDTLRKHNPPLSEIALANEQSAFETAIRKAETEWLFNDMRRESEEYAALSTQRRLLITAEEFARFARAKLNATISIVYDRASSNKAKVARSSVQSDEVISRRSWINSAGRFGQGLVFVQSTQLKAKDIGRTIWLNTFGKRFQSRVIDLPSMPDE